MKQELIDLIKNTIVLEYQLPNSDKGIEKSVISTIDDHCYKSENDENLAKVILNSIIHYSYDTFEFNTDEKVLFNRALGNRIRYSKNDSDETKLNYGFFGEVLLYSILRVIYKVPPLITKGHFTIIGNGESKGYDSYHLIQTTNDNIHLWFGEVKFRGSSSSGIKSALDSLSAKILTDDYLKENNLIPIFDEMSKNQEYENLYKDSKIIKLRNKWIEKGVLDIDDLKKDNIKLVYPILISYDKSVDGYEKSINNCVNYIKKNYADITIEKLSIPYSIFFIFLPVENVKIIKEKVLKWIELEEPLI